MQLSVKIYTIYRCTIERAFKTPLLCDVALVHTGYGIMPRITHCTDDALWGAIGSSKKVYAAPSITQKGGFVSVDHILEREENVYWKFEVDQFQSWMLGFTRFTGEWRTTETAPNQILIEYTYTLHANTKWFYPLNWLFVHLFWKRYMQRVLRNVEQMIAREEPYLYP